jgi:TetR/AcrR family transcriptional regulator, regulator of autoinduction and epiphytic fitness
MSMINYTIRCNLSHGDGMMVDGEKIRRKRDTHEKRQVILEGAVKVFIESGYDVSSMDKIAEVAGVSKRTVYNHFQSKESLFQAVVDDFLKQRDQQKPIEYSRTRSLEDQLRSFAEAELYLINDPIRRGLSRFLTSVFIMDIEFEKKIYSQAKPPNEDFIKWLNAAQADGKLQFPSAQLAAQIFYGLVEGCLTYNALFSDGASLKFKEPVLTELVLTFIDRYGIESQV